MIKKLLIVAVSGLMLALISIGAAVAIGGPQLRGAFHDGHFVWDSDGYRGPVIKKELTFDASRPLEITLPVDMHFVRGDKVSMIVEGPKKAIDGLVYENGELRLNGSHHGMNDGIKLTITAPVLPPLDISGPANVEIVDLRQREFKLSMAGAGNVTLHRKPRELDSDIAGLGNVDHDY